MLEYENKYTQHKFICGVDEAGAGPVAGPVVACAIIMPKGLTIPGVTDSKKLSEKKRNMLEIEIKRFAIAYSLYFVDNNIVDEINILQARLQAMKNAVDSLSQKPDFALVDGHIYPLNMPGICIKKGDSLSHSIACASILAKVARDEHMVKAHDTYPQYNFAKHKGYGTKAHFESIKNHGLCPIHRKTFLKNL